MNKELTLEQRIARLEKLLNNDNRSRKYESRTDDFYNAVDNLYEQGITNSDDMVTPLAKLGFRVPKEFSWGQLRNAVATAWHKHMKPSASDDDESQDLESSVEDWFDDNMGPDMYDSKCAWVSDLKWMAKGAPNGSVANDCCDSVGCDDIDEVTKLLAKFAKDALDDIKYNKAHGQDTVRLWTDPWA